MLPLPFTSIPVFLLNRYLSSVIRLTTGVSCSSSMKYVALTVAEDTSPSRKAFTRSGVVFFSTSPSAGNSLLFSVGVSPSVV